MPTDELEHELRRAIASAAAEYQHPEQAKQRLLQRDYRPGSGRRRLTAGGGAAAVAGSVALRPGPVRRPRLVPALRAGTIRTAAFTITRNANGTATLTINARVLFDPSTLQGDLAQYGIPAKVTSASFCSSDPAPGGFSQAVTFSPAIQGATARSRCATRPSRSTPPPCPPEPNSASAPSRSPTETTPRWGSSARTPTPAPAPRPRPRLPAARGCTGRLRRVVTSRAASRARLPRGEGTGRSLPWWCPGLRRRSDTPGQTFDRLYPSRLGWQETHVDLVGNCSGPSSS